MNRYTYQRPIGTFQIKKMIKLDVFKYERVFNTLNMVSPSLRAGIYIMAFIEFIKAKDIYLVLNSLIVFH